MNEFFDCPVYFTCMNVFINTKCYNDKCFDFVVHV